MFFFTNPCTHASLITFRVSYQFFFVGEGGGLLSLLGFAMLLLEQKQIRYGQILQILVLIKIIQHVTRARHKCMYAKNMTLKSQTSTKSSLSPYFPPSPYRLQKTTFPNTVHKARRRLKYLKVK